MTTGFLDPMWIVPNCRITGMVSYPLDETVLSTLLGIVFGADDGDGVAEVATGALDSLRGDLPFTHGVATAQTLRSAGGAGAWFCQLDASVRPLPAM